MKKKILSLTKAVVEKLAGRNGNFPYIEQFTLDRISFKYWITDKLYQEWYRPEGHKDWVETKAYLDFVSENDKTLEVGCNNGFTTAMIKSLIGRDTLIVGLDIIPANVMIAQAQVGLNNFNNCHILNLGADEQKREIFVQNTNNGFVVNSNTVGSIRVGVIPCDDLIAKFSYFDILKIDVEGYEANVLRGCREILSRKPKIIIEIHGAEIPRYNATVDEIFDMIGIDDYEGVFVLRSENVLHKFDKATFPKKDHSTLFLRPKKK
jgi:FkbM family methyltransferase